ncbi:proline/glycine betaine ABC transporter permease [Metallumcola ferriviriculae]|uniref:Proline/glycine betaine ABC transporter permease n=1 Tax=Metallumcola ferriviriculae TaxID=3039180 RepID=A0AAU0UNM9_9FIRM|nr:proline/glycine betaine ABC transporter permease [Desulfitibacteraceae bacterium MK1]
MIPKLPLGPWLEFIINFLDDNFSFITKAASNVVEAGIFKFQDFMMLIPYWLVIALVVVVAWRVAGRGVAIFAIFGLALIVNLQMWPETIETLAMVLFATLISMLIGLPLGIWSSRNEVVNRVVSPVLDFMQTMPAFVYLIPVIPFFGLGNVPAVMATVIFAMPPVIRLTNLGIRQVPAELIEASESFGSTPSQKLYKVQLPLALPTIMAGVNQTIMLSLSMVVIAAMIGARGLGGIIWSAIQRLETGSGFESGIGVVIVAIILDRVTQKVSGKKTREE